VSSKSATSWERGRGTRWFLDTALQWRRQALIPAMRSPSSSGPRRWDSVLRGMCTAARTGCSTCWRPRWSSSAAASGGPRVRVTSPSRRVAPRTFAVRAGSGRTTSPVTWR
jgi:hypothetical protein